MKASRLSAILFAGSLLFCASVLAGNMNKKTMHLYENAKLGSKTLSPGDYRVEWSGSGPNVELNIDKDGSAVATVPAHVVAENASHDHDGYVLTPAKSGGQAIEEIFFSGKKYDLKIEPTAKTS